MPQRFRTSGRFVATVLFTDIVGSTELASSLGDRGWATVLDAHHGLVRRELRRFGGREIDTAGDGFLAAFDAPGRAIRCAEAIGDAMWQIGLEIRAGLHTGECQLVDGKVAGIAVHIGARVAARAEPGEILVTSTVRDVAAGGGIELGPGDRHPEGAGSTTPIAAIAMTSAMATPLPIVPYSIQLVTFGGNSLWVAHSASAASSGSTGVLRIDPATLRVTGKEISLPSRPLTGIAFGEHAVWATLGNGQLARIDAGSNRLHLTAVASSADDVATGEGYVWILNILDGALIRFDPEANRVRGTVPVNGQAAHLAVGEGAVWITVVTSDAVERIPATLDSNAMTIPVGSHPSGVAIGEGSVWVVNRKDGTVSVFEAARSAVKEIQVGGLPDGMVATPIGVWVTVPRGLRSQ